MTFVPVETLEQVIKIALSDNQPGTTQRTDPCRIGPLSRALGPAHIGTSDRLLHFGHGFGHASRTIEVINANLAQRPETRVGVRTSAPRWLFDLTVKGKVTYSTLECDTGVVQVERLTARRGDSIRRAAVVSTATW
jgi:hypothetical protein